MDGRELGNILVDNATYVAEDKYHAIFRDLRKNDPLSFAEPDGYRPFWIVSKYADIRNVELKAKEFLNEPRTFLATIEEENNIAAAFEAGLTAMGRSLVNIDGEDHRSLRAITRSWFAPANVRALEEKIRAGAKEVIDDMVQRDGRCDFVNDVALWYPLRVIMLILGLPREDEAFLLKLTQETFAPSDPDTESSDGVAGMLESSKAIGEYFAAVTADRRKNPTDDVASVIANAKINGVLIPDIDVAAYYLTIITAGHDTTSSTTAGGLLALLRHPEEFAKLRNGDVAIGDAINEFLRWTTPLKHFFRTAAQDCEVSGKQIKSGDSLMMCYPSGNRDEDVFESPFTFDLNRSPNQHLAFGYGPHVCLGQHLAKLEMRIFYEEFLARISNVTLAGDAALTSANFVQGLKRLPIEFSVK